MLKILDDNEDILHIKCLEITLPISKEDKDLGLAMLKHLYESQDAELAKKYNLRAGVGLAAPQVGVAKRMFAILIQEGDIVHRYVIANPKIKSTSILMSYLEGGEGCLSVNSSHEGIVRRYYRIKLEGFDVLEEKPIIIDTKGYLAIALQHEFDHLQGILFYDRFNPLDPLRINEQDIAI